MSNFRRNFHPRTSRSQKVGRQGCGRFHTVNLVECLSVEGKFTNFMIKTLSQFKVFKTALNNSKFNYLKGKIVIYVFV